MHKISRGLTQLPADAGKSPLPHASPVSYRDGERGDAIRPLCRASTAFKAKPIKSHMIGQRRCPPTARERGVSAIADPEALHRRLAEFSAFGATPEGGVDRPEASPANGKA